MAERHREWRSFGAAVAVYGLYAGSRASWIGNRTAGVDVLDVIAAVGGAHPDDTRNRVEIVATAESPLTAAAAGLARPASASHANEQE